MLHPGEFVLGSTLEFCTLPDDLAGRLEGKSSLGRLGLLTHSTAGFIDPGFTGHITLELSNVANLPITLWPGMKIGQLCLLRLTSPAEHPYGSAKAGSPRRQAISAQRLRERQFHLGWVKEKNISCEAMPSFSQRRRCTAFESSPDKRSNAGAVKQKSALALFLRRRCEYRSGWHFSARRRRREQQRQPLLHGMHQTQGRQCTCCDNAPVCVLVRDRR